MKVILIPRSCFEIRTEQGISLGIFTEQSQWNGLVDLQDGEGNTIIVEAVDARRANDMMKAVASEVTKAAPCFAYLIKSDERKAQVESPRAEDSRLETDMEDKEVDS